MSNCLIRDDPKVDEGHDLKFIMIPSDDPYAR